MLALPPEGHKACNYFILDHLINVTIPGTQTPAPTKQEALDNAKAILDQSPGILSLSYIVRDGEEVDLISIHHGGEVEHLWRFTDLTQ